jgi:Uma2 family endonuclease
MTVQQRIAPGKYRLRAQDYTVLGDAGVFGDRVTELRAGEIFVMSPEWRPHMRVKDEIAYRLRRAIEATDHALFVGTGGSVAVSETDLPRPDILLTRDIEGDGPVPAASVAMIVEVSASTLDYDLGDKATLYAVAGIPEYWVVDLGERNVHHFSRTTGGGYAERHTSRLGAPLTSTTIAGLTIDTTGI